MANICSTEMVLNCHFGMLDNLEKKLTVYFNCYRSDVLRKWLKTVSSLLFSLWQVVFAERETISCGEIRSVGFIVYFRACTLQLSTIVRQLRIFYLPVEEDVWKFDRNELDVIIYWALPRWMSLKYRAISVIPVLRKLVCLVSSVTDIYP